MLHFAFVRCCGWLRARLLAQHSNPIVRLRHYLEAKGWWSAEENAALMNEEKKIVLKALHTVRAHCYACSAISSRVSS